MRTTGLTHAAAMLALIGLVIPRPTLAQSPQGRAEAASVVTRGTPAPEMEIVDIALADGGVFKGQVVDGQGQPIANVDVVMRQQQRIVASTTTDENGNFHAAGLQGGICEVATGDRCGVYRVWTPRSAPPAARQGALLVSGQDEVVRGQRAGWRYWMTNPWVLGGLLGAAIAVPIALSNSSSSNAS